MCEEGFLISSMFGIEVEVPSCSDRQRLRNWCELRKLPLRADRALVAWQSQFGKKGDPVLLRPSRSIY